MEPPLARASAELRAVAGRVDDEVARDALAVVADQLDAARSEIGELVVGAPPVRLGDGWLEQALFGLADRCPTAVSVSFAPDAAAAADVEATLYYVVAEALTNAAKHAGAFRVEVTVRRLGHRIEAAVTDDGRGGADPGGGGLAGLADRLATRGGRLRVDSPLGAGTALVAVIPDVPPQRRAFADQRASRSGARARGCT